jgi:hypothetical protein
LHPWSSQNLTPDKEFRLFRHLGPQTEFTKYFLWAPVSLPPPSLDSTPAFPKFISFYRTILDEAASDLVAILPKTPMKKNQPDFPLRIPNNTVIGKFVMDDLKRSWKIHHVLSSQEIFIVPEQTPMLRTLVKKIYKKISKFRLEIESGIHGDISLSGDHKHLACFRILQTANIISVPTPIDLVRASFDSLSLHLLHPLLDSESRNHLRKKILMWMEFCVMEDKLGRISTNLAKRDPNLEMVKQEVQVYRNWIAADHPRWLAMEVEGGIQIRPQQYVRNCDFENNIFFPLTFPK